MNAETLFQHTLEKLRTARHVVISTGAGISAESGIATFRDPATGLWSRYKQGELASAEAFEQNPALVWGWYSWRRMLVSKAKPNAAHLAVAELEQSLHRVTLITQNVDDLHERAGSRDAIHLHGHLTTARCYTCNKPYLDALPVNASQEEGPSDPPHCQHCDGLVRPNVVWFGEKLSPEDINRANAAALDCDVFLSVGTSESVAPAVYLPILAAERGAWVVHINLAPSVSAPGNTLIGTATSWLPRIAQALISV
ncbi:NAD-dependent deacetylase [Pseudomonas poae]|jgi:NAD-dependent deacetylase|uniref:NAD-dependent protein deacylase n=1 Tax=Pseudomonas poae TaxID=200451 RepID=A0A7Z1GUX0_9PSED|nr:NAD-dependent deacylase [Pseudomonas poae]PFG72379.1 NAD-dependent deacetylase [Pseudomonas poae]